MFSQVYGHRLVLGDAGADAIGSLATLAPIRTADHPALRNVSASVASVFSYRTTPLASVRTNA